MLIHPQFDPVAVHLGPLAVHWYGLMYLLGFTLFLVMGKYRLKKGNDVLTVAQLDDMLMYGAVGVVLGGRLGEVLFYQPGFYFSHPLEIFMVWKGGMSFHGGFIGVLVAVALYGRKVGRSFWQLTDFVAPLVPLGLAAGRVGNFINGELWGRVASPDLPWAMLFPQARLDDVAEAQQSADLMNMLMQYGGLARHPSQLYEFALEGIALFSALWIYSAKPRATGKVSALFLIGYGLARFCSEFFRNPDAGIFGKSDVISMGQWLSLPMIIIGVALFVFFGKRKAA
ncbi:prolipoprotein diacylglyceryl transferase [Chromobacterium subtsugae]|uniref:Phosphatidylglycerol--prolipoprotein diacylglyceryl transferase n=1 Tax=Chromobacterium subtsugae TaxID=251747 RepID=A0ABS7F9N0_9NEIS|nr:MULTISPECIES: prolipoprotein diacylglyceryl transferase [Chromobacterium]KUM02582.1 prolipoprotein diacylglyceryl transferase [Chromobacterium subtsugae]KZE87967.1 prolipoprotein diacylglyceryl transferase [Chromobacterium sp. F49]MBW7565463.1 prolipoprotein diacylglyceryl transferase [Chromobacterium subtsugae]MBW8286687.1 prolipoprotein diacylglyceryl transferase [Chromobacterium subtsugae]WSE90833.1 prolipoprotein diacylglyceryl transferase [Chromobacterium subtsugae]